MKWRARGFAILALVFLTVTAYWPALRNGFVWDDDDYVTHNRGLTTSNGLYRTWFKPGADVQYYPLVWLEHRVWGLQPLGYHIVNVALHALNAVLWWFLLRRLTVRGAWFAAAIFALHPVLVESVAWITERKNLLSAAFYLAAMLAYLRFRQPDTHGNRRFYGLALVLFLCALWSKTVAGTFPAAVLLVLWWQRGRITKTDVIALLPFFALGAVMGLTTVGLEKQRVGAVGSEWAFSFVDRCLIAGRALWFYVGKLIFPSRLTFIYPRWQIDSGIWWQYLFPLSALAVLAGLWWGRQRIGKAPVVSVLFFAGTLVPALGFFNVYPMRFSFVADHFQYLASMGLIALSVGWGVMVLRRWPRVAPVFGGAVLIVLGTLTWKQTRIYESPETLWHDTLAKNPDCWLAHSNLGVALANRGLLDQAIAHHLIALRLKPDDANVQNNLATALAQKGELTPAIQHFRIALQLNSNLAQARYNLALGLIKQGQVAEAIQHLRRFIESSPTSPDGYFLLGKTLAQQQRYRDAIQTFRDGLARIQDEPTLLNELAKLLACCPDPILRAPTEALQLAERLCHHTANQAPQALDTLAVAYAALGQFDQAAQTARQALDLIPAETRPDLAAEVGDHIRHYEQRQPACPPGATR